MRGDPNVARSEDGPGGGGGDAVRLARLALSPWDLSSSGAYPPATALVVTSGVAKSGAPTREWQRAVEEHQGSRQHWSRRPLTTDETGWRDSIGARLRVWQSAIPSLMPPFEGLRPVAKARIVLGNQHGEDAFGIGGDTIFFDLSALARLYGPAAAADNRELLDRIFAHEFSHVLQSRWESMHPFRVATPWDRALRQMWREGLGNLYSLSEEWVTASGDLTPRALGAIAELEPTFVDRLCRLRTASESEEPELRRGLSSGSFAEKWGALPVALWLAQEAKGDGLPLRHFVQAGSDGVLLLARRHLIAGLAALLPPASPAR